MIEFVEKMRGPRWGVAFGHGSWVYIDNLGTINFDESDFAAHDRGFRATSLHVLRTAIRTSRDSMMGPYGRQDSAKRRQFCALVAERATQISKDMK